MNWIRRALHKSQAEKSLDEELQFHLERAGGRPFHTTTRTPLNFRMADGPPTSAAKESHSFAIDCSAFTRYSAVS